MIEVYYMEDDEAIAQSVREYLAGKQCSTMVFSTLEAARTAMQNHVPSIVLVDWNMPDGQGDAFCRWVRSRWRELPLIFLTVRGDSRDVVSGFRDGADDYVVKPFELEVLYSRICALLRRSRRTAEPYLSCGAVLIDQEARMAFCGGDEVNLSQQEYQVLLLLMLNKGRTVPRETLLAQVWDSNGSYVNNNTLTVTVKRLREKLRQPSCIKTVRSFGYRMEEPL